MKTCKRKLEDNYLLNIKLLTIKDDFEATQSKLTLVDATLRDIKIDEDEANQAGRNKEETVVKVDQNKGDDHTREISTSEVTIDSLEKTPKLGPRQQFVDSLQYKGNLITARTAISSMVKSYISSKYANDLQKPCPHCTSTEIMHVQQLADIRMWRKTVADKRNV